ncbi:sigma-70 family RNA polymerase sigma factor [Dyadobacter sp. 676]|uniref:Sigma-70 family RNA polymerase sigma factor n=1 Tax=Dyadobacter sp. 676 TaxID=3088362 RepID=A0AAU8FKA4_9BACT
MHDNDQFCDQELFGLIKTGDQRAFTALYRRHWQSMFNAAYKRLQCKALSQDMVQNIFIDLWERRGLVEVSNVQAYLHTAIRFQVFKQTAREGRNAHLLAAFEANLAAIGSADEVVLEEEVHRLLALWIEALPEKRREIFLLHCFEGRSTAEIADQLDISRKTVQNQLNNATTELRSKFDKILCIDLIVFSIFFQ